MAPVLPDVEAIAVQAVADLGVQVMAYDAQSAWPFVTDRVALQVDAYGTSKKEAHDIAYTARGRLIDLPVTAPAVARVEVVSGPMFLQAEDGKPRYVTRMAITVRADRGTRQEEGES